MVVLYTFLFICTNGKQSTDNANNSQKSRKSIRTARSALLAVMRDPGGPCREGG